MLKKFSAYLATMMLTALFCQPSWSFGRVPFASCQSLFPELGRKPILQSTLRRLVAESQSQYEQINAKFESLNVGEPTRQRIRQIISVRNNFSHSLLTTLNAIERNLASAPSVLRPGLQLIVESWLEIGFLRAERSGDISQVEELPTRLSRMLAQNRKSNLSILILKQKIEDFAELLSLVREISTAKTKAFQDFQVGFQKSPEQANQTQGEMIMQRIIEDPGAFPKMKNLRERLLSLTLERRQEFAKSCLH